VPDARQYRAFDYRSFCRIFLGRFWVLFEIGYYALLLLVLSVLSSAAGKLLAQMFGLPELINSILFMAVVAFVVRDSLSYTGYNVVILPILIFVARNFETRREALIAGALAGPLILLPGLASIFALSAFYPGILTAPLPISVVLAQVVSI
jgi:uncharacterized membrane protein YkvI